MERVLTDDALRDRLVAEASEHMLRFDWADVARRTAEVYADLVPSPEGAQPTRGHDVPRVAAPGASAEVVAERLERGEAGVHDGLRAADAGARLAEGGGGLGPRQALVGGRRLPHRLADRGGGRGVRGLVSMPPRSAAASAYVSARAAAAWRCPTGVPTLSAVRPALRVSRGR